MKLSILFFISICFMSCASFDVNDKTFLTKEKGYETSLHLDSKGIFYYEHNEELVNQTSKGTWEIQDDNQVVLNSYKEFKFGIISVREEKKQFNDIKIIVLDINGNPIQNVNMSINDSEYGVTDDKGCFMVKEEQVNSIKVNYLSDEYLHKVKNKESDLYTLVIKPSTLDEIFFQNEYFTIKGRSIVWNNENLKLTVKNN